MESKNENNWDQKIGALADLVASLESAANQYRAAERALAAHVEAEFGVEWSDVDVDTDPWEMEYEDSTLMEELEKRLRILKLRRTQEELERQIKKIENEIADIS